MGFLLKTFPIPSLIFLCLCFHKKVQGQQEEIEKFKNLQKSQMKVDKEAKKSQKRVTEMADKTKILLDRYRGTLKDIENTKAYNEQLHQLIKSQREEKVSIEEQIESVKNTSKNIYPFMLKMLRGLEEFISLDVPFLMEERTRRLKQIKSLMDSAKVSASEKFRRIIEAYQIENEYGRTMEAYRGIHEVDGKKLTVDFLRMGRISLVYQTLDSKKFGYWDQKERGWKNLPGRYRKSIQQGVRMARKQLAPDLVILPVPASTKSQVSQPDFQKDSDSI